MVDIYIYIRGFDRFACTVELTGKPECVRCTTVQVCPLLSSSLPDECNYAGKTGFPEKQALSY